MLKVFWLSALTITYFVTRAAHWIRVSVKFPEARPVVNAYTLSRLNLAKKCQINIESHTNKEKNGRKDSPFLAALCINSSRCIIDGLKEHTLLRQPSQERRSSFKKVFNIQMYFFLKTDWGQPGVSAILRSKQIISGGTTMSAVSSLLFRYLLHNWRILTSHQAALIIINPPIRLTISGAIWLVKV